jgi:hypothetical protein
MRRNYLPGWIAGLIVSTVVLGGCGGGGGGSDSGSANAPGGNAAPTVGGTPSSAVVGQAYSFQPSAADANGDRLTFSVANLPSWATFNAENGRITGTPTAAQVGSYANISVTVSDGSASATLGPFNISVNDVGTGSATLSWTPPTTNSDGSNLGNLSGYRVMYGRTSENLDQTVNLDNPSINRYVLENLSSGTWFFAVVSVTTSGLTSQLSNTASKTVS